MIEWSRWWVVNSLWRWKNEIEMVRIDARSHVSWEMFRNLVSCPPESISRCCRRRFRIHPIFGSSSLSLSLSPIVSSSRLNMQIEERLSGLGLARLSFVFDDPYEYTFTRLASIDLITDAVTRRRTIDCGRVDSSRYIIVTSSLQITHNWCMYCI